MLKPESRQVRTSMGVQNNVSSSSTTKNKYNSNSRVRVFNNFASNRDITKPVHQGSAPSKTIETKLRIGQKINSDGTKDKVKMGNGIGKKELFDDNQSVKKIAKQSSGSVGAGAKSFANFL